MHSAIPSVEELRDLEVLLRSRHPLLFMETVEDDRAETLLAYVADRIGIGHLTWTANRGLFREGPAGGPIANTTKLAAALAHLGKTPEDAVVHVRASSTELSEPEVIAHFRDLYRVLVPHRGAVVLTAAEIALPRDLEALFTPFELQVPTERAYHQFVSQVLRDLKKRMKVEITMTAEDVASLLQQLRGLTFFEVRKIVTQAVVEDGSFGPEDIARVHEAKKRIVERSGVLDYFPVEHTMEDVAGLATLKAWLKKRKAAFADPARAASFGLSPPRGLLLVGVQGCGKSLSAKTVASEWRLPLLRLDPSNLYQKFFGESEKSLKRAIKTAEQMAPVVLWIDEIEKAFGPSGDNDGGTSTRIFGTFLSWLQEKKETVFVVATANDIAGLPPELMRKGRFDEIFFLDLPNTEVRRAILDVHVKKRRKRGPTIDLDAIAEATAGFSGAEIEQAVVSALYSAFATEAELTTELLLAEVRATKPLSTTMSEKLDALRTWAKDRTVSAD